MGRTNAIALAMCLAALVVGCSESVSSTSPFADDQTPPTWSEGATLRALEVGRTHATLEWSAATDDLGVAQYRVFVNGVPTKLVSGTTQVVTLLQPDTQYELMVQAIDRAGRASRDGLAVTVRTRAVRRASARPAGVER